MWQETENGLYKKFVFDDFKQAFAFMSKVADLAEMHNHHPTWSNTWNSVEIWLSTHDADGQVTEKDTVLAKAIDGLVTQEQTSLIADKPHPKEIKLYSDGGSRGNPGPSAGGFVLLDMDDNELVSSGKYLGITTNNQAEYHSLKGGLEAAKKMQVQTVHVYMDSQLVINQMLGIYKIKNRDLWPIHQAIKDLLPSFKKVTFTHVPRELNKLADAMVNETLDSRKDIPADV